MLKDKATFGHRIDLVVIYWFRWGVGGMPLSLGSALVTNLMEQVPCVSSLA
jgi:hypothetical protein